MNERGEITVTLSNCALDRGFDVEINGFDVKTAEGRILSGEVHAHNDFDNSLAENFLRGQFVALCFHRL